MTTEAAHEIEINESEPAEAQNKQQRTLSEQVQEGEPNAETAPENSENKNNDESEPDNVTKSPSSPVSPGQKSPGKQKKEKDTPEGKGISRFLPPWLKKQKSQSIVDPKEDGDKGNAEESADETQVKEDEEKTEGVKSDDQQLVESKAEEKEEKQLLTEAQPAKEENKEEEIQVVDEKDENEDVGKEITVSKRAESKKESILKSPKKVKIVPCKVTLLDGTEYSCEIEKRAKGQVLFVKVCEHLNLLEIDYFGLTYRENADQKNWLDPGKEIKRQIRSSPWLFVFNVKFYPPDPSQLTEDITRYFLCLQLRQDISSGRLPCSFVTHALLGSYTLQAELGDYDADEHSIDYISDFKFAPNQTKEMEDKVVELHKTHRGLTPAQADMQFLENAKKLSMYGVDLHHAKDSEAVDIMLGVCANGLLIYKDRLRINRFAWPKILKISYKRSNFYIKVRPGELEQFESTIGFKLPNHRSAKRLWKVCVEHHTFYRLSSPEQPPKARFLTLGSKFRYSGRTQAQTREASTRIDRPAPYFERTSSKRVSRSLDGAPIGSITDQSLLKATSFPEAGSAIDGRVSEVVALERENGATVGSQLEQPKDAKSLEEEITSILFSKESFSNMKSSFTSSTEWPAEGSLLKDTDTADTITVSHSPELPEKHLTRTRGMRTGLSDALESSDEIQNVVEEENQSIADTREICNAEEIKLEVNGEVPNDPNGEIPEVEELDKVDAESLSSSDSSSASENDEVEYKAESRLSESVLKEELEESVEEVQACEPEDEPKVFLAEEHTMTVTVTHSEELTTIISKEVTYETSEVFKEEQEIIEEEKHKINGDISHIEDASAQIICCSEPPVVKTEMVTISDATQRTEISTKDVPIVQTETKTITFESPQLDGSGDNEPGTLLSAQTITSDSVLTTTTTHITKTGKGGISETRIEKRIVISGDADIDHDEALAQAIKEAKEQHPDMSITRVVVHKETEVTEEGEED
ncbi:band 4.1-like protein 2 isoform X11 [Pelobates fuscus]|uniref:band 4.1-like protein 2 isoform X11 n=1 Tax=Pelobates fuscus TaxID=191477 RepID=UPI002FE4C8B0